MYPKLSPLKVMQSNAGFYLGKTEIEKDGSEVPYSRESEYFPTEQTAKTALVTGEYVQYFPEI